MSSVRNRLKRQFSLLPKTEYILPLCFLSLTGITLGNFLLLFFLSFRVNQLAKQKVTFVQLSNGNSVAAIQQDGLYRQPEIIKNVVRNWATLTFNWDGKIFGTNEIDQGYDIGNNQKVTTNAYFASFLIQPGDKGFRQAALQLISALTPYDVYSGKYRSLLVHPGGNNPPVTHNL